MRNTSLPRGNKSGISYGQKKQQGQSDLEQLVSIQQYLIKKYKSKVWREWYLIFDKHNEELQKIVGYVNKDDLGEYYTNEDGYEEYKITNFARNPDLMWADKYGLWVIEVDGAVHDVKVKQTNERNELYLRNHIKLIVVNLADLKETKQNIFKYIDKQIARLI